MFLLLFIGVFVRLAYWQIARSADLKAVAQSQYQRQIATEHGRGNIFTHEGYPLAMNQEVYTLFANPKRLSLTPGQITQMIAPILESQYRVASTSGSIDPAAIRADLLGKLSDTTKSWVSLKRQVDTTAKAKIESLDLAGLGFDPGERRYYPEGSMAAHLLGFVSQDTNGDPVGYFGVEGRYDLELKGKSGQVSQESDAFGRPIAIGVFSQTQGVAARDITLSIRRDIQHLLEEKLQAGAARYGAKSADAVILEPSTGKVIAMASYPTYDPSLFSQFPTSLYRNPVVGDGYEPGSTLKVLTVASGIDAGVITPDTPCDDCGGPKTIGKYTIKTWNNEYTKDITMTDALAKSDNTAMMFVAKRLGKEKFLSYIHAFGIGNKTGIDVQDESTPQVRPDNKWAEIDVATASFGQGIATTPIQLVSAVNAIANKGVLLKPYVVEKVTEDDKTYETKTKEVGRIVSEQTARTVTEMMITSANHGDAKWALPKGYEIAGKTGTAQIPVDGHYDDKRTIASFVGFAPAKSPQFTMLVRVSEPTTSQWGSETAAPLWFAIAKELFLKMGISPTSTPTPTPTVQ